MANVNKNHTVETPICLGDSTQIAQGDAHEEDKSPSAIAKGMEILFTQKEHYSITMTEIAIRSGMSYHTVNSHFGRRNHIPKPWIFQVYVDTFLILIGEHESAVGKILETR